MNRRTFIHQIGVSSLGVTLLPSIGWKINTLQNDLYDTLIGKDSKFLVGTSFKLHQDAFNAFNAMSTEANKDGINIKVVSAHRSFERQKSIFESKYRRFTAQGLDPVDALNKIIEYSTIPGTSRHHWGTDLDIIDGNAPLPNDPLLEEHFYGNGPYCKLKVWLNKNAHRFDFHEVYSNDPHRKGFAFEPWHYSYAPVSIPYLKAYKEIDLFTLVNQENLLGKRYLTQEFLMQYKANQILDINPRLLP